MDGENNGKPYEQMDDLVGHTPIFGSTPISCYVSNGYLQSGYFGKSYPLDSFGKCSRFTQGL